MVKSETTTRFYESLTFDLDIAKNNGELYLSWENTQIRCLLPEHELARC
ncbi:MAG: hypothetical protein JJE09_10480 [Bacteroidia bacterium]|nr:hypothetical protein [Bacteroidia bacterium]